MKSPAASLDELSGRVAGSAKLVDDLALDYIFIRKRLA
jgi:hypothetical protein